MKFILWSHSFFFFFAVDKSWHKCYLTIKVWIKTKLYHPNMRGLLCIDFETLSLSLYVTQPQTKQTISIKENYKWLLRQYQIYLVLFTSSFSEKSPNWKPSKSSSTLDAYNKHYNNLYHTNLLGQTVTNICITISESLKKKKKKVSLHHPSSNSFPYRIINKVQNIWSDPLDSERS